MKTRLFVLLLCLLPVAEVLAVPIPENHPSAYLRLHANDAVKWQLLDDSVLSKAKKQNKLIFISSGFSACHWCHVMRDESFNDRQAAAVINTHFIPVKVDRELDPVLDAYLIEFVRKVAGHAGWPLNVLVTPDGYPLTGFVYLKKPELISVLTKLQAKWQSDQSSLQILAVNAFKATEQENTQTIRVDRQDIINAFLNSVRSKMDELEGGFGLTIKTPKPYVMMALLEIYQRQPEPWLQEFIVLTLKRISERGLHDMPGGGFFRYTTDPSWQTPHFEKMLYLNAAMIELYLKAHEVLDDSIWLHMAEETMDFLLREMRSEKGMFVSSLSAQDAQGVEGGAYLFSQNEIDKLLNQKEKSQFAQFARWMPVGDSGGLLPTGIASQSEEKKLQQKLLAERNKNPARQELNIINSWNAYLLRVALKLQAKSKNSYTVALSALRNQLEQYAIKKAKKLTLAEAVMIADALSMWADSNADDSSLLLARQLLQNVRDHYWHARGWVEVHDSVLPMPGLKKNLMDGDLPAADVVYARLSGRGLIQNSTAISDGVITNDVIEIDQHVLQKPMKYASFVAAIVASSVYSQAGIEAKKE